MTQPHNHLTGISNSESAQTSFPPLDGARSNPRRPPRDATAAEVQIFLRDFFIANNPSLTQSQAEERAGRLKINGDSLYRSRKKAFVDEFGSQGIVIYDLIQHSEWEYVSTILRFWFN